MKKKHRNSQKRIHIRDGCYFLTSNTKRWYPFFTEKIFCEIFIENLRLCRALKQFRLYGWFLDYNNFHLLIQPGDEWDVSKIMKSLKENVSYMINQIISSSTEGETLTSRLQEAEEHFNITQYIQQFHQKYPHRYPFPKFQWQRSFHDHIIRNEHDFIIHLKYLEYLSQRLIHLWWKINKHHMPEDWKYTFMNPEYEELLDEHLII